MQSSNYAAYTIKGDEMKNNIGKMFGVLVLGGSMMAVANGATSDDLCQTEVVSKKYDYEGTPLPFSKATCIDEASDETVLKIVEESRKEACNSPFCGCWLG